METELGVMSNSLTSISKTLDRISEVHLSTKLLEEKFNHLDKELLESFERVHKRIDEEANARMWGTRLIIGTLLVGAVSFVVRGGLA